MDNYIELLKFLKVSYENIYVLHHNIVSENFFADHEKMGEYYELIQDIGDTLIEDGIALGKVEPTIEDSVDDYEVIGTQKRDKNECYQIVKDVFNEIIDLMQECKGEQPDWLKNKIEEYQEQLYKESNYKIEHLLDAKK